MTTHSPQPRVIGGVDTHADTIHVAAIDATGRPLGDREFPTDPAGYAAALDFLGGFGDLEVIGVEGTSSYGAGFTRTAAGAGIEVREVTRPDRSQRRRQGKSDPLDAYQAAAAVLAGRAEAPAKHEEIEAIRALHNARRSAVKARTAAMNQIHHMLITAPVTVREKYRHLTEKALITALAKTRPAQHTGTDAAVLTALKALAQRHQFLTTQAEELHTQLRALTKAANPALVALRGVGPITAAQLLITVGANPQRLRSEASFAALCGTAPVPASSGKTHRHRLSRGGDRAANHALHTIALVRMATDPRTRAYVTTQRHQNRATPEVLRLLKRALAREIYHCLTQPSPGTDYSDLQTLRRTKNITVTTAAQALGTYPTKIRRTELGTYPDHDLADRYRTWLTAA